MVEDFVAYVGCVTGLGDCLLGHPLWQAVVLFCKSGLANADLEQQKECSEIEHLLLISVQIHAQGKRFYASPFSTSFQQIVD